MAANERFRIKTAGDLEAVVLAETFDLLADVFGPYCFRVSGAPGDQQVVFKSRADQELFYQRVSELLVDSTDLYEGGDAPRNLSLLDGGRWLIGRYDSEAAAAGWAAAADGLVEWLDHTPRFRFWSGELWRHVRLEQPMGALLKTHANLARHSLIRLGPEVRKLQAAARRAGGGLSDQEAVAAREEFAAHLKGMMEYHATRCAEAVGRYFVGFYWFVRRRYEQTPTNHLDEIPPPPGVSDKVFHYMYASTIHGLSRWTEERLLSCVPETSPNLAKPYPQHEASDPDDT